MVIGSIIIILVTIIFKMISGLKSGITGNAYDNIYNNIQLQWKRIAINIVAIFLCIAANYYLLSDPITTINARKGLYPGSEKQIIETITVILVISLFEGIFIGEFASGVKFLKDPIPRLIVLLESAVIWFLFGLFGVMFADAGLIKIPAMTAFVVFMGIGGSLFNIGGLLLLDFRNKYIRAIGGAIFCLSVTLLLVLPVYYAIHETSSLITPGDPINKSKMLNSLQAVVIISVIFGGILGYLGNKGLRLLKFNNPIAFIGICGLVGVMLGVISTPFMFIFFFSVNQRFFFSESSQSIYYEIFRITEFGSFMLMIIWIGIGALAGIASVVLKYHQTDI